MTGQHSARDFESFHPFAFSEKNHWVDTQAIGDLERERSTTGRGDMQK
jgi:hypothetical protein